jgi:hypothetical protein
MYKLNADIFVDIVHLQVSITLRLWMTLLFNTSIIIYLIVILLWFVDTLGIVVRKIYFAI